ncbi:hypothetical protein FACS1894160_3560 [Bacteroidia bacterium]|nr:hypothetical protein FACS1894123_06270 [Bacteroidia bacterium]GHV08743.1 hypothetical protein FACS1894160_3560 [Bacteroidia bacterium]
MDAKTKFLELKEQWKKASEAERPAIEKETESFLDSLTEDDKKEVFVAIDEDFKVIHEKAKELKTIVDVRKKLEPVLPAISISHLTKKYFKKSPNWFYQRMNGNRVNGKIAKFSSEDLETLNFAIHDIEKQLSTVKF